jgi:hypothetical protein
LGCSDNTAKAEKDGPSFHIAYKSRNLLTFGFLVDMPEKWSNCYSLGNCRVSLAAKNQCLILEPIPLYRSNECILDLAVDHSL